MAGEVEDCAIERFCCAHFAFFKMSETFLFTVDSALLGELGERLVTSVHIALTELVKNAYDADATKTGTMLRISGAFEDEWKQGGFDYPTAKSRA